MFNALSQSLSLTPDEMWLTAALPKLLAQGSGIALNVPNTMPFTETKGFYSCNPTGVLFGCGIRRQSKPTRAQIIFDITAAAAGTIIALNPSGVRTDDTTFRLRAPGDINFTFPVGAHDYRLIWTLTVPGYGGAVPNVGMSMLTAIDGPSGSYISTTYVPFEGLDCDDWFVRVDNPSGTPGQDFTINWVEARFIK